MQHHYLAIIYISIANGKMVTYMSAHGSSPHPVWQQLEFLYLTCVHRSLQVKIPLIYFWKKEKQHFDRLKRRSINFKCPYLGFLIHMRFQKKCVIKIWSHVQFFSLRHMFTEENSIWIICRPKWCQFVN